MAAAVVASVAIVTSGGLVALRMVLAHKAKSYEHAPLAQMQGKLDELEQRLLGRAWGR